MAAVAATEFFEQRIRDNPDNRERILAMDPEEFCSVMRRWRDQFSQPNPVGDLTEEQLKSITCPVLAFEGNTPDDVHHKSAAENVKRLVPNSELRPRRGLTRNGRSSVSTTIPSRASPPPIATT